MATPREQPGFEHAVEDRVASLRMRILQLQSEPEFAEVAAQLEKIVREIEDRIASAR